MPEKDERKKERWEATTRLLLLKSIDSQTPLRLAGHNIARSVRTKRRCGRTWTIHAYKGETKRKEREEIHRGSTNDLLIGTLLERCTPYVLPPLFLLPYLLLHSTVLFAVASSRYVRFLYPTKHTFDLDSTTYYVSMPFFLTKPKRG